MFIKFCKLEYKYKKLIGMLKKILYKLNKLKIENNYIF